MRKKSFFWHRTKKEKKSRVRPEAHGNHKEQAQCGESSSSVDSFPNSLHSPPRHKGTLLEKYPKPQYSWQSQRARHSNFRNKTPPGWLLKQIVRHIFAGLVQSGTGLNSTFPPICQAYKCTSPVLRLTASLPCRVSCFTWKAFSRLKYWDIYNSYNDVQAARYWLFNLWSAAAGRLKTKLKWPVSYMCNLQLIWGPLCPSFFFSVVTKQIFLNIFHILQ